MLSDKIRAAKAAPLLVGGDEAVRARHGYTHFVGAGFEHGRGFEHTMEEWLEERSESMRTVSTEMSQWQVGEPRATLSEAEMNFLIKTHAEHLDSNSAFPANERAAERKKVLADLDERVNAIYSYSATEAELRKVKAPPLSPPLPAMSGPLGPHGTSAGNVLPPPTEDAVVTVPPSPPDAGVAGGAALAAAAVPASPLEPTPLVPRRVIKTPGSADPSMVEEVEDEDDIMEL